MVQEILIFVLFIAAAFYVGRLLYSSFSPKSGGCAKGCGSACSSIDFKKIQQDLERRKASA